MTNLFKKAAVFTDIHFGLKNNSVIHNNDCLEFIDWMIATAKDKGCETAIFLGDWTHQRASVSIQTMQYSLRGLEKLSSSFDNVYFLVGNHDLFFKDKRDVYSTEWAKYIPNIHMIDEWFNEGNVTIIPWLIGDEHKRIEKIKSKYVFGHFELPHFKMNANVLMPDHGSLQDRHFSEIDMVFSGHFHMRQHRNNIHYIGNCFPHNFGDSGDADRGMMILEWGGQPEYHSWPNQPIYKVLNLSTLVESPEKHLGPNMSVKVELDIPITYEEASFIKESLVADYQLRDMAIVPKKIQDAGEGQVTDLKFESVDQVVISQITSLDSDYYNPKLLLSIYQGLN